MSTPSATPVVYAKLGDVSAFQRWRTSAVPLPEIVARSRSANEAEGLWNLQEIDPQALLSHGGYEIRAARQLLFFHPRFVDRLLAADPAALLEAPLKFVVLELPDGTVTVRWADPMAGFARYLNKELEDLDGS
jgi:uncharacterized protein (DUF302 family)